MKGAEAAAKARAKRAKKVVQSAAQPRRQGRDMDLEPHVPRPGIMLVREEEEEARRKAKRWNFKCLTSDPVVFVDKVAGTPKSKGKGHVVLAPFVETDFGFCAQIAAGFMGAFFADPKNFVQQGDRPHGVTYKEKCKASPKSLQVAVSAAVEQAFPTLPVLLRHIAEAPGSCLSLYLSEKKLCRYVSTAIKDKSEVVKKRIFQRACILSMPEDKAAVQPKYRDLYIHPRSFILRIDAKVDCICPGCPQVP